MMDLLGSEYPTSANTASSEIEDGEQEDEEI